MQHLLRAALAGIFLVAAFTAVAPARAADATGDSQQEGYYYPKLTSNEVYKARAQTLDGVDRRARLKFVNDLTKEQAGAPYPPTFVIFAKGDNSEKLIIIGMQDGGINTLYRARALFAGMSAMARLTPFFKQAAVDDIFTFFDLAKLMGFTQITVSDGRSFAHRVTIQ
jgi:hypothetical protein